MKKCIFVLILFLICNFIYTENFANTIKLKKKRMDNYILSKKTIVPSVLIWSIAAYEIKSNPYEYEGKGEEKINFWLNHLNTGTGLHLLGVYLKNYQSKIYYNNLSLSAKILLNLGELIALEDCYQHFFLQKRDNFSKQNPDGSISYSPLYKFYNYLMAREHQNNFKCMFKMANVKNLYFSIGFYQGPAAEFSYNWLRKKNLYSKFIFVCSVDQASEREFNVEQQLLAYTLGYTFFEFFSFEIGVGVKEINSKCNYLKEPRGFTLF